MSDDDDWEDEGSDASRSLALLQSALEASSNSLDEYVQEAMDANYENGYFDNSLAIPSSPSSDPHFEFDEHHHVPFFMAVDPKAIKASLKAAHETHNVRANTQSADNDVQPGVFLSDQSDLSVIQKFNLNKEQTCAFHALGIHPVEEPQL